MLKMQDLLYIIFFYLGLLHIDLLLVVFYHGLLPAAVHHLLPPDAHTMVSNMLALTIIFYQLL